MIPFEIHLTVGEMSTCETPKFLEFCDKNCVKPILIELAEGETCQQPMLSKMIHSNSLEESLIQANELSRDLIAESFEVRRLKIEVNAEDYHWINSTVNSHKNYFEWHAKIEVERLEELLDLVKNHGAHLSINSLQKLKNIKFITLREFGNKDEFYARIQHLKTRLIQGNWTIIKEQSEYCIYDNNRILDKGWISSNN